MYARCTRLHQVRPLQGVASDFRPAASHDSRECLAADNSRRDRDTAACSRARQRCACARDARPGTRWGSTCRSQLASPDRLVSLCCVLWVRARRSVHLSTQVLTRLCHSVFLVVPLRKQFVRSPALTSGIPVLTEHCCRLYAKSLCSLRAPPRRTSSRSSTTTRPRASLRSDIGASAQLSIKLSRQTTMRRARARIKVTPRTTRRSQRARLTEALGSHSLGALPCRRATHSSPLLFQFSMRCQCSTFLAPLPTTGFGGAWRMLQVATRADTTI